MSRESRRKGPEGLRAYAVLAAVLALALVFGAAAAAGNGIVYLPASVTAVEAEAFMGDSLLAWVELPEGLESIGARAFRNCPGMTSVSIPESVTFIGEDAFDDSVYIACWEGSPAIAYAAAHGNEVYIMRHPVLTVESVTAEQAVFRVSSQNSGYVVAELIDPGTGAVLESYRKQFSSGSENAQVTVNFWRTQQRAFAVRAYLVDDDENELSAAVTSEVCCGREEFEAKTPESFAGGVVLNYGSEGFGVLRGSVRTVTGTGSGGVYTVESAEALSAGDALYLPDCAELILAASVTDNGDGSYTVTKRSNARIQDFYQYLNYSTTLDAVTALEASGASYEGSVLHPRASAGARYSRELTWGDLTAQVNTGVTVTCNFRYDADLFGPDYLESEVVVTLDADIRCRAEKEYSFEREVPLFAYSVPTTALGVLIDLDVRLPLQFTARASAELATGFTAELGMVYDSGHGAVPIRRYEPAWSATAEGELSVELGPRVSVGVSFLRMIAADVGVQAGVKLSGAVSYEAHSGETEDVRHGCDLCLDVSVEKFIELSTRLTAAGTELCDESWPLHGSVIFDGYLSILNSRCSVHRGQIVLGEGECPNLEYKTTVRVEDPDAPGETKHVKIWWLEGIGTERELVAEGDAPLTVWLPSGCYAAESDHLGHAETMDFDVEDCPSTVMMDFTLVPIDADHFPDPGFRAFVAENYDRSGDGMLNSWERSRVTKMELYAYDFDENDQHLMVFPYTCTSLQGIEYFNWLTRLDVRECNLLTDIDLSHNTELEYLTLWAGSRDFRPGALPRLKDMWLVLPITELDVSQCTALEYLDIGCALTTLEISGHPTLKFLEFSAYIPVVRLTDNSKLARVSVYGDLYRTGQGNSGEVDLLISGSPDLERLNVANQANYYVWHMDLSSYTLHYDDTRFGLPWYPAEGSVFVFSNTTLTVRVIGEYEVEYLGYPQAP